MENVIIHNEESNNVENDNEETNKSTINMSAFYDLNYTLKYKDIDITDLDYTQDNTDILEKYDQTYREDLLLLFKLGLTLALTKDLNAVLNSCSKSIYQIYEQYKDNEQIIEILSYLKDEVIVPFELDDNTLFVYLFSCDYLEYFQ